MKSLILCIVAICLLSPSVFADQITLKNGDRLTGDVVKSDDKVLVLKSEFAGEVSIQWDAVETITSTQTLHVGLKDGETVVGTVTTRDGKVQLQTKDAGAVLTAKDSIVAIRSDKEQAAYDMALDRLQHPHLTDFWGGFVDASLSTTRGNSDTLSFVLGAKAVRAAPSDKITVYMNSVFAKNDTTGTSLTTAHAITGGIRGDLNMNAKLSCLASPTLNTTSSRCSICGTCWAEAHGLSCREDQEYRFDLSGGGAYDQAFYSTGVNLKSGEIVLGEQLSYHFSSRSDLSEQFQFFPT